MAGGRALDAGRFAFASTLLRAAGDAFLAHPHGLQTEAFGTVNLVVLAKDVAQMVEIATSLEGNLTGTIYSDTRGTDDALYARLAPALRSKVGRLLNDKMPTGVAVTPAMNHGGPYPATGHPGFTAVGIPASLLRFAALHCYDDVRAASPAPGARGPEPDRQDVAARWTASGLRRTSRRERARRASWETARSSPRRAPRRADRKGGCRSRPRCCSRSRAATCSG